MYEKIFPDLKEALFLLLDDKVMSATALPVKGVKDQGDILKSYEQKVSRSLCP